MTSRKESPARVHCIATESAKVGEVKTIDKAAVRARATANDLVPPEDLDRRQQLIGANRRAAGPPLAEDVVSDDPSSPPAVSPTECDDQDAERESPFAQSI